MHFLQERSYANAQGLQAIQNYELEGRVGIFYGSVLEEVKTALRYAIVL